MRLNGSNDTGGPDADSAKREVCEMTDGAKPVFECQRCGGCCFRFSELTAFPEDIDRWVDEGREDILQYADEYMYSLIGAADLWIDPETGEPLRRCPFLRKVRNKPMYRCLIYDTRPGQCRSFPHLKYNEDGELIAAHSWAVENCPGVKVLLKDWTPQRIQALRDQRMIKKLIVGGLVDEVSGAETESLMDTCVWCDNKASKGAEVYVLGATAKHKSVLGKKDRFISLALTLSQKTVQAFVAPDGSRAKGEGWDFTFIACSLDCAKALQAALRQETDIIGDVSY
jgi:Fe-S-cluster containining protein